MQEASASGSGSEKKLWGGRFTGKTDPLMEKFNESLPFDKRMWAEDIRVSNAEHIPYKCTAGTMFMGLSSNCQMHSTDSALSGCVVQYHDIINNQVIDYQHA
jgi:hypothetical protein